MTTEEEKNKIANLENSNKNRTEKGIACDIRPGIWRLLSDHLYKDRTVVYRELISNACDAINKKIAQLTQEFKDGKISKHVLDSYQKKIKIYISEGFDDVAVEDNGIGLDNFDEFQAIGKTKYKDNNNKDSKNIGLFGVGKLTGLRASNCETVVYESIVKTKRGGLIGMLVTLQPDNYDVLRYVNEPIDSSDIRKTTTIMDTGTRVTIKDVLTKDLDAVRKYISETFAVKIAEQFQISIISTWYLHNDKEEGKKEVERMVEFPEGFDPKGQVLFSLSDGTLVVGVLNKSKKRGVIKGSYKGVFIQELDLNYKIEDWSWIDIVSENVRVTVGRDSFVTDDSTIYQEFEDRLKTHLDENGFEKADTVLVSEKQKSALKKAQYEQIILYKRFFPNDTLPEPLAKLGGPSPTAEGGPTRNTGPLTDKEKPGKTVYKEPLDPDRIIIKRGPYVKHQHREPQETGEGGEGPETNYNFLWLPAGKLNLGYYWDPIEQAFIINLSRPSWRLFNKKKLEKAAIHEIDRATLRACPENKDLETFEKKYQELIDGNIDRTWTP